MAVLTRKSIMLGLALVVLILTLTTPATAASRTSFCKCSCGRNGTIIPLDATKDGAADEHPKARSCADCNRQFCLEYDLPILADCKAENKGKEEDIVATCFQRDSAKDQAVVYSFIVMTVGLLGYAGLKPYLDKRKESNTQPQSSGQYAPMNPQ